MKKELEKILNQIENLYFDENVSSKQKELSQLWTRYYQLSSSYQIELPKAYDLYLLGENLCYVIDIENSYQTDLKIPLEIIKKLKLVIEENQKQHQLVSGITFEEANTFLTWVIKHTWNYLSSFGIDIKTNSLNGFCEIAQLASIYPLEQFGLSVTKNTAEASFGYIFHHVFGTVEIPISQENRIQNQIFLIDPTYKQFFTVVRCNFGRFYAKEENTGKIVAPDPGYFMKTREEINICQELISKGYLPLTEEVAKIYGTGFQKASISLKNTAYYNQISSYTGKDYLQKIKTSGKDYMMNPRDLEGYDWKIDFSNHKNI